MHVGANYHLTKLIFGIFILVAIKHLSKQTISYDFVSIMVTYLIFHNMTSQAMLIKEINQFQHHLNHNANTYELEVISGYSIVSIP